MGKTICETLRLRLRDITEDDVDSLHAIFGDPEAMAHMPQVYTREEVETRWVGKILKRYEEEGYSFYAVELKKDGTFLGICGPLLQEVTLPDESSPQTFIEVGYHFQRAHWGHGYATEAALAVRDLIFETYGRDEVISLIDPKNSRSEGVAKRIGETLWQKDATYHDQKINVWRITRNEWNRLDR